jgi:hypothetical protein
MAVDGSVKHAIIANWTICEMPHQHGLRSIINWQVPTRSTQKHFCDL